MAAKDITNFVIYRWRYILGYSLVGILLIGLLVFAGLFVPGGISLQEIRSTVLSDSLNFSNPLSLAIPNLPFYVLQAGVFNIFGIDSFTIKLPSLIIGLFSAVGLVLLLRRWFKSNIAVLASLLAITTGQFLFIAQNGAPGITFVFWPIALLLLGTQVTRAKKGKLFWKLAFAATAALSLYTPLSIYPLLAALLATILHPHLRSIVRRLPKPKVALSVGIAAIILAPLGYSIFLNPSLGLTLLGAPLVFPPDIAANFVTIIRQFFLFWEPSTTTLMTPVFGFGSALIIVLGMYRLFKTRDTTRSYLLIIWIICLVPVILISPRFTSVLFVPSVLLLAAGLTSLIAYWYRLFPLNPYARIAGLVPLIVLVVTLVGSGLDRYIYGYHYDPSTAVNFSKDLRLLPKDTTELVVTVDDLAFYQAVARHRDELKVVTEPTTNTFVSTRAARTAFNGYYIDRIITTTSSKEGDRLYVYKKLTQ